MSRRFILNILEPLPADIDLSYGEFKYGNFGLGCWFYHDPRGGDYDGIVEWINSLHFCSEPKYINPAGFRYWLKPGLQAYDEIIPVVNEDLPEALVDGIVVDALTGRGFPLFL